MVELESHKIERTTFSLSSLSLNIIESKHLPVAFHLQIQLTSEKFINRNPHPVQFLFVPAEYNHIIHISDIVDCMEFLFYVVVERLQHEI